MWGMVTEASAIFVARTIFLVPSGTAFHTSNCFVGGRPAYNGQTLIGGPGDSCNVFVTYNMLNVNTTTIIFE